MLVVSWKHNIYISVQHPRNEDEYLKKIVLRDDYGAEFLHASIY